MGATREMVSHLCKYHTAKSVLGAGLQNAAGFTEAGITAAPFCRRDAVDWMRAFSRLTEVAHNKRVGIVEFVDFVVRVAHAPEPVSHPSDLEEMEPEWWPEVEAVVRVYQPLEESKDYIGPREGAFDYEEDEIWDCSALAAPDAELDESESELWEARRSERGEAEE